MKQDFENSLKNLQETYDALFKNGRSTSESLQKARKLSQEILDLERVCSAARGETYANEWEIGEVWNGIALFPLVISSTECSLVFPTKDKTYALLTFRNVRAYKLENIGDETLDGHSLRGHGLTAFGAFIIENSPWIQELKRIEQSHSQYFENSWKGSQHFMLCFKDCIFESVATQAEITGVFESYAQAKLAAFSDARDIE